MTDQPAGDDRASRWPWPPIIYAVALTLMWWLDWFFPFDLPDGDWRPWAVVAAIGLGIGIAGFSYFQVIGTTFNPTGPATVLATGGIYRFTRNPMYLGGCVFFLGLAIMVRSGWLLLMVPVIAVALRKLAIEPEEAYLTRRFGDEYRAYCGRVRRWL